MYLMAFFGVLMCVFSLIMIANPEAWSNGIISFSTKSWFHPFEIGSRLAFGLIFITYADQTVYPRVILAIGYLLIGASLVLLIMLPSRHRRFAVWSASKFRGAFRPAGVFGLVLGAFIVFASVSPLHG
jgi:hypothetical protein